MRNYKTRMLSLLILFVALTAIFLTTRNSEGRHAAPDKKTIKVLRKKEQLGVKPSAQEIAAASLAQQPERELEDRIPKHLPIKVKVKNLNNEKWTREVEIEIKNTGDKPIYFLMFSLFFVDVKMENGDDIGFPFRFGRPELFLIENKATPEDRPIQPGETYVIKAPQGLTEGWEKFKIKRNLSRPKKIGIRFYALNHGDGTGFETTGGLSVPKPRASKASGADQRNESRPVTTSHNAVLSRP
jgi:hypothetical protein